MVTATKINEAAVQAAANTSIDDGPVFMVNLLRYKKHAEYDNPADGAPCSGREAYFQRYVPAFNNIAANENVKVFFVGNVYSTLVAPEGEQWDDVAIVEYPSFAAFRRITECAAYHATAAPHRNAALENWRLLKTSKMAF
jgi:uncharacterized protein (DUF1330 family)